MNRSTMGDDEARPAYTLPTSPIIFLLGEMMIAPPDTTTRVQRILAVPFIQKCKYICTHKLKHTGYHIRGMEK